MTIAIPDWFLTSYSPYSAVDIIYNSITTRYLIDSWSIALDGQEAAFSCGLLELGTVASGIVTPRFEAITQQTIETGSVITVDQVQDVENVDPNFSSVALLLHFDGSDGSTTFVDNSNNGLLITPNGNAQISTANFKFEPASGNFDGAFDYLILPTSTALNVGTGDFTIEMFASSDVAFNVFRSLFANGVINTATGLYVRNDAVVGWFVDLTGWTAIGTTALSPGTWYYFAVKRAGGTLSLHVGTSGSTTLEASVSDTNSYDFSTYFIASNGFNQEWGGQIDEFRITKGIARDVSAVPTVVFPDA